MKLVVFDFDSTLMDGETIDFLACELGFEDEVAKITTRAMAGELDFFDSLVQRVALLKGLSEAKVNEICVNLPLINGAKETISGLKEMGFRVICFSGGFRNATEPICRELGIDADFSNYLHAKDGVLTGLVGGEMMFSDSKGKMLLRMQELVGSSYDNTIVVGDGANDLSMFSYAKTKVAFCAKPILREAATHCIDNKDLTEVLDIAKRL